MNQKELKLNALPSKRLLSLDTYRGLVMFCLIAAGFGLSKVAENYPDSGFFDWVKFNTTHPEWASQFRLIGFSLWDMIQPAFMFMVGVSMPYSYGKRKELGQSWRRRLGHAWLRALILTLLGVFLASSNKPQTVWLFTNVLSQIGLGYGFLFFLVGKQFRAQLITGASVLIGYWLLMILLPTGLSGFQAHFANGTSLPQQFDLWFLNLFPRAEEFTGRDYGTLNFVPAFVTMLMGLMAGQLLKSGNLDESAKLKRLLVAGAACLLAGLIWAPICPIVKKLWTPSWALFSGAYVIWLLAILYWVIDVKGWSRGWTWFFSVVGANSIAAYFMGQRLKPWTQGTLKTHLPNSIFEGTWEPFALYTMVALFFWMILWWMHRNKVFVRV
ncbi:MAG: heparan-alpha-glucosaminide N-acetyltransferase [Verrucomicrobiales bacterium]